VGIAIGRNTSGVHSLVDYLDRLRQLGPPGASALDFSNTVGNAAASLCGIEFGLRGPNVTLSYKEASSMSAVAYAVSQVRAGRARAMVTGGVDDIEPMLFDVHDRFGALATDQGHGEASRPFDRRRNGFVMGTGAFALVIEPAASAAARHAPIAGELLGVGATSAPAGMNDWPREPAQIARAMRLAIADAGLEPREIGVVFASANSTVPLDRVEAAAIADVFGESGVPVVSIKGAIGECGSMGTAGILAAVLSAKAGAIPPTAGFADADPECPVDVSAHARPWPAASRAALVNSLAAGGACYAVVVRG
jgi:3-oxoacyl-[acyl-carrier-protein] synthase II